MKTCKVCLKIPLVFVCLLWSNEGASVYERNPFFQAENDLTKFCLQPKGQFPINNSCNKYVNCWNGVAIEQSCSSGFHFNPIKLYCDYPANVDCKGEKNHVLELPNDKLSQRSLQKFCLKSRGLFPGSSCGKFVNCWEGNAVEQDCPVGLHFSPAGFCDYPEKVACQELNDINGIEFFSSKNLPAQNQECPLEFGMFRDRTNCSQYYTCSFSNIVARYACAKGFSFSDVLGLCDYSYRVDCTKHPQIYQRKNFRALIGDPRCTVLFGYSRDANDCSMYHVCQKGLVVATYRCPQGFRFNNKDNSCDHSGNVQCDSSSVFFNGVRSVILPNIPKGMKWLVYLFLAEIFYQVRNCVPGTIFRLNPQCTSACRCQTRLAEIIQCSEGLAYDSQKDKCVPINVARC
ncbi:chondroitin proteoglycan-2-like [Euwallacea similis]|uniref:chondroitin proteoglycan-2-like n=1 Tax=Euwallacea similis TaxID=1736056 RepID=UPI0034507803